MRDRNQSDQVNRGGDPREPADLGPQEAEFDPAQGGPPPWDPGADFPPSDSTRPLRQPRFRHSDPEDLDDFPPRAPAPPTIQNPIAPEPTGSDPIDPFFDSAPAMPGFDSGPVDPRFDSGPVDPHFDSGPINPGSDSTLNYGLAESVEMTSAFDGPLAGDEPLAPLSDGFGHEDEGFGSTNRPSLLGDDVGEESGYEPGVDSGLGDHLEPPESYDENPAAPSGARSRVRRAISGPLGAKGARRRKRVSTAVIDGETDSVGADSFAQEMERIQYEASAEQRSAWVYLGVLGIVCVGLFIAGVVRSPDGDIDPITGAPVQEGVAVQPVNLVIEVSGDEVTVSGLVPSPEFESQLLETVLATYGAENVVDRIEIDPALALDGATLRFVGSSMTGDDRPEVLQSQLMSAFEFENRGFEVGFVDVLAEPVVVQMVTDGDLLSLSGTLPDDQAANDLFALVGELWGPEQVTQDLLVGATVWDGGTITITGSIPASDPRVTSFVAAVPSRLASNVNVDISGLTEIDLATVASQTQIELADLVTSEPIQFTPTSADIAAESDSTIAQIAERLKPLSSIAVSVVGHTDSVGGEAENQELSEQRAQAVVDRLVELGIPAELLTAVGEGESNPIAEEDTDEGKAANRRIEFRLDIPSSQ